MATITARISKQYFGEPIYLREMVLPLFAAALGMPRSDLQFKAESVDDETPEASVVFFINSVGNDVLRTQLAEAMVTAMHPAPLTFAVHFTVDATDGDFADTSEQLKQAIGAVQAGVDDMTSAHLVRQHEDRYDAAAEIIEKHIWDLRQILKQYN